MFCGPLGRGTLSGHAGFQNSITAVRNECLSDIYSAADFRHRALNQIGGADRNMPGAITATTSSIRRRCIEVVLGLKLKDAAVLVPVVDRSATRREGDPDPTHGEASQAFRPGRLSRRRHRFGGRPVAEKWRRYARPRRRSGSIRREGVETVGEAAAISVAARAFASCRCFPSSRRGFRHQAQSRTRSMRSSKCRCPS